MIEYKKATLDKDTIEQLIKLSYLWEEEDITFGLHHNTESDLHEPCYIALDDKEIVGYIFGHYYNNEKVVADIIKGDKCFDIDELHSYDDSYTFNNLRQTTKYKSKLFQPLQTV